MLGNLGRMAAEEAETETNKQKMKKAGEKAAEIMHRHINTANKISKLSAKAKSPATNETIIVAPTTDEDIPALKKVFWR